MVYQGEGEQQVDVGGQGVVVQPTGTAADELVESGAVENDDTPMRKVSMLSSIYYANEVGGKSGNKIFYGLKMG